MSPNRSPPKKRSRVEERSDSAGIEDGDTSASRTSSTKTNCVDTATDDDEIPVFSPAILNNAENLAAEYKNAKPYQHGIVNDLFVEGFLDQVLHEVKHNLKAKYKESDLFRVYQSIDLGNLDPSDESLQKAMPAMIALRKCLYSQKWRSNMEKISGIESGTLTDEVDCAVNCHDKGCHLLCHDDVIGTRKISYILYLTDPDPVWKDADGGRLELYESCTEKIEIAEGTENRVVEKKVPGVFPVKTVLPSFNSMAYFAVEPGVSFHSVQEVFCNRPRLSIQGWYHAKEAPQEMEHASLNQLKSNLAEDLDIEGTFTSFEETTSEILSEEDLKFLSIYINETYLKAESMKEINERFEEESSVQLRHFFKQEWESKISELLQKDDEICNIGKDKPSLNYSVGVSDDLVPVGPPHKQRFLEYIGQSQKDGKSCGPILKYLADTVMKSSAFGRLLQSYSSLGMPRGHRGRVRRFRPGLDYTIAHFGILTKEPVLDATLCFVSGKGNQSLGTDADIDDDDDIWQSDDKGGFECYIAADDEGSEDDQEAPDEYDDDDDTKLLSVSASNNTLSLVYRDPGTMRFVKYLGVGAPSSRWDVSLEYELEVDDSDEDEAVHEVDQITKT